ncbi:SLIT-ROBO Rho GTPase activating protein [Sarotherodon galilaeus]
MADSSANGQRRYKALKDQVEELKKAIRMACTGTSKAADKECRAMEAEVSKIFDLQHKGTDERTALEVVLRTEGERCEKKLKNLQDESGGRSVNRKIKKEMTALKVMHGNCCKWMMMCNAVSSWMKDKVEQPDPAKEEDTVSIMKLLQKLQEDNEKLEDKMAKLTLKGEEVNNPIHTPAIYPWIPQLPSAPPQLGGVETPPPYVMPVMSLDGGQVQGPDGQTGIVIGGLVNVEYPGVTRPTLHGEMTTVGPQNRENAGTQTACATGPGLASCSRAWTTQNSVGEAAGPGVLHTEASPAVLPEEVPSQDEEDGRSELVEPPHQERQGHHQASKQSTKKPDRWDGQVHGRMHEDRDALLAVVETLTEVKQKALKELMEEELKEQKTSRTRHKPSTKVVEEDVTECRTSSEEDLDEEEEEIERRDACEPDKNLNLRSRTVHRRPTTKLRSTARMKRKSVFDVVRGSGKTRRSRAVNEEEEGTRPRWGMPLIVGPKHEPIYRAYKVRDLEALVRQLPPITEGGAKWLRKLDMLTEGDEIAIGDFRAAAGRVMLGGALADVEEIAGTTSYANNMPYREVRNALADAVREKYPTPNTGTIPKITWDPLHTPREFLERAKEQWMSETGIHPGQEGESRAWFRAAVLAGLPKQVRTDLEKNPDFAVADSTQWERHLTHRLTLERDEVNKLKKDLEDKQAELLKLQLNEAREKYVGKKKEIKEASKAMMVAKPQPDPVPEWPDLDPNLYPDDRWPVNAPRQRQPVGNWGAARSYRGRGGYAGRGQRARGTGNPSYTSWNACYRCGVEGHWARDCPGPSHNTQQRGYHTQARGAPRGRGAYRGGHQAPNPGAAPVAQYPVADWGWEGEQY